MKIEELTSYRLVEKKKIEDLNSMSYLLEHKKSGARLALLSNDDENKVFYIGSNHREPPRLYTNQRKLCRKPLATETDEFH